MPEWKAEIRRRLAGLSLPPTREAAIVEEVANDLEDCYADWLARGASAAEAYQQTLAELSEHELLARELRHVERYTEPIPLGTNRRSNMIADLWQDLRFGARMLAKQKSITAIAVLSLALGIGANTALFSVVDAVLLKTLPVKEPERLALFGWSAGPSFRMSGMSGWKETSLFRHEVFIQMRQTHLAAPDSPLSDFFAFAPLREVNAVVGDQAEVIPGQVVSGGYYNGLGVQPLLGRAINEDDDKPGAASVVVLSHGYWQERFSANPAVIGQTLKLNQQAFTTIGVTPPDFDGTLQVSERAAVTIPLACEPILHGENSRLSTATAPGLWWLGVMGRLKSGATQEQARASLNGAFQTTALALMPPSRRADQPAMLEPKDYPNLQVESGSRGMLDERRNVAPTIYALFIVVALVLLIACANVANLLLARATSRRAEITVRLAVGAGRGRLMRQLLTESVLLAGVGGVIGVLFALWGNRVLIALTDKDTGLIPNNVTLNVNWRVLAFTLAVSLLTGVLFGLAPAWRATKLGLATSLKQSRRTTNAVSRLSKGLIVAQVALSLLLLVGAGVFIRTLYNLQRVNLGFNQENLLVFKLRPVQGGYKDERRMQFYRQLFARLDDLPGVRAATFGRVALIAHDNWANGILLPGEVEQTAPPRSTFRQMVRENYFATLEIPLLRGRGFTVRDDAGAPQVAIVNQTFARRFFPNDEVLGKQITFRRNNRTVEIIGVVADASYETQRKEIPPLLYTPWQQESEVIGIMNFTLRTTGEPTALAATVRQVIRELDSNLPMTEISSQTARSNATLGQERLSARLLSFFGGVALLLASIGLSGVLAYSVSQRTNEIGIRMALGAQTANVLRLVIGQGMKLVLLGMALGILVGYGMRRWWANQSFARDSWQARLAEQLYGVNVTDPLTIAVIALLLLAVALLACWIPARRATKVDPMIALRNE